MFKAKAKKDRITITRVTFNKETRGNREEVRERFKLGDVVSFSEYYGKFWGGKRDLEVAPLGANGMVVGLRNVCYREDPPDPWDPESVPEYYSEQCLMVVINASQNPLAVPLSNCNRDGRPFKSWHTNQHSLSGQMKEAISKHPEHFPRDSKGRFV